MATNFPSSQDSFTNPTSSDTLDSPDHAAQHTNVNDAVEAIELALLDGAPLKIDDTNERVGIGTTSPATQLQLSGSNGREALRLSGDGGGGSTTGSVYMGFHHWATGTHPSARIGVQENGTGDYDGSLLFETRNSDADVVPSTRMVIDQDGKVGIGTTSPSAELDVAGDYTSTGHVTVQSGGADSGIVLGQAFSSSYVGLRTGGMAEDSGTEYVLITDGSNTFLGAGGSGTTYIRAGSNSSTHQIRVTTSGAFADGNLKVDDYLIIDNSGSYSSPSLYWGSDSNTGFYRHAENSIGVATGGGRRTLWNTDANLYHYSQFLVPNMSTTSSYNTVRFNTGNGQLMRFSSTIDIKEDVVSIAPVLEYLNERSLIHHLRPVLFHEKDNADGTNNTRGEYLAGMIAQEVLEVAPELCYYDYNGNLTSYGIEALIPHIVAEIQRLSPMVEELYGNANPDWVAPIARPASRSADERTRYDEAAAAQAEIGLVIPAGFETEEE